MFTNKTYNKFHLIIDTIIHYFNNVYTQRKVNKLQKHVERAKKLRNFDKKQKFNKELKKQAREIRNLKMTTTQYIKLSEERLGALKCKVNVQQARAEALGVRIAYKNKPSIDTISHKTETVYPNYEATVEYFKNQYSESDADERFESPIFNKWIKRMIAYRQSISLEQQLEEQAVKSKITTAIINSSPWKAL